MKQLTWHNEERKINDLIPFEGNPRKMSEKQVLDLRKSIEKFGLVEIPVIDRPGANPRIVAGHQRMKLMQTMGKGDEMTPVRVPNRQLTQDEYVEYNIRSNKNTGDWDFDLLANFNTDLLREAGFSSEEMDKIFDINVQEDDFDADAEAAKIGKPVTQLGDLYIMGRHRMINGDSTKREVIEKVMDGKKADMIFTDPPYNVNYSYAKYTAIHKDRKRKFVDGGKIFNDNKTPEAFYEFLMAIFRNCYEFSKDSASMYCCYATKSQEQFFDAYKDAGWHFSQTIIWMKERLILAMGQDYHRIYEPIIFGWKKGKKHYSNRLITKEKEVWDLDKIDFEERLDLWYLHRDKSSEYIHPTQKPVRLPERAIKKNCVQGGVLLEPFMGSGSTMMACEQTNRACYGCELDPRYCDVIVKRWEQFTGQKAERITLKP